MIYKKAIGSSKWEIFNIVLRNGVISVFNSYYNYLISVVFQETEYA